MSQQDINVVVNPQNIFVTVETLLQGGTAGFITLTGDVTGTGEGTIATTLADTAVTAGEYDLASITVDSKGRVTNSIDGKPLAIALAIALG